MFEPARTCLLMWSWGRVVERVFPGAGVWLIGAGPLGGLRVGGVFVGTAAHLVDGVFECGQIEFFDQCGCEVDLADVGQAEDEPEAVGQFVGEGTAGFGVGEVRGHLSIGAVAKVFDQFAQFAHEREGEIFRVVELLPVAFA